MSEIQDLLNASTQDMVDDYLIIDDNSREIYVPYNERNSRFIECINTGYG
nr:MAG TPA: hypothetical protein [Caudoviricetes sp.]